MDDKSKRGPQDAQRININEGYEVRYWTEALDVSREQLERAVKAAGPMADDVRRHLSGRK